MGLIPVVLLIISGVTGVILTIWGRVSPPETTPAKRGFVAVGGVMVVCIVAGGDSERDIARSS